MSCVAWHRCAPGCAAMQLLMQRDLSALTVASRGGNSHPEGCGRIGPRGWGHTSERSATPQPRADPQQLRGACRCECLLSTCSSLRRGWQYALSATQGTHTTLACDGMLQACQDTTSTSSVLLLSCMLSQYPVPCMSCTLG